MKTSTHYILHAISIALIWLLSYAIFSDNSKQELEKLKADNIELGRLYEKSKQANEEYQKAIVKQHAETTKLEMMKDSFQKENNRLRRQLNSIKYEISLLPDSVANDSARDEITRYIAEFDL